MGGRRAEAASIGLKDDEREGRARRLPAGLGTGLGPDARVALDHPVRRRILRALHADGEPRSARQLARGPSIHSAVTLVSYHARVLRNCGMVDLADTRLVTGTVERFYASTVAEDDQVLSILRATEELDDDPGGSRGPRREEPPE